LYTVSDEKIEYKPSTKELMKWYSLVGPSVTWFVCKLVVLAAAIGIAVYLNPTPDMMYYPYVEIFWIISQTLVYIFFGVQIIKFVYDFLIFIYCNCFQFTADESGITLRRFRTEKHIPWHDIKDYGLSYQGYEYTIEERYDEYHDYPIVNLRPYRKIIFKSGRIYKVYFSADESAPEIKNGRKKLGKNTVWWLKTCSLFVTPDPKKGTTFLANVFAFCEKQTGISPFIPGYAHSHIYRENKPD
jgi:hypothetical protein